MKFSVQLSCDYPDPAYGGKKLYAEMIEQAVLADRLGFDAVMDASVPRRCGL